MLLQTELRLLLSIAANQRTLPKQGDVSQVFVQSTLPTNEQYIARPPAGCPISKPNTYLRLIQTLYGLKRSPRHWYNKATTVLESLGLQKLKKRSMHLLQTHHPGSPSNLRRIVCRLLPLL